MNDSQEVIAEDVFLPVLREELNVQIRKYITGIVRLDKTVRQIDGVVDEALLSDSLSIEHVPVNRYIDEPAVTRQDGDTMIFPVMEEIIITTKKLVLKEEIRITRHRTQTRYQEVVPLRSEEVFVERLSADGNPR